MAMGLSTLSKPDIGKGLKRRPSILWDEGERISIMARSQRLHRRPNTFAQTTFAIVRFSLATLRRTIHTDKPTSQALHPIQVRHRQPRRM